MKNKWLNIIGIMAVIAAFIGAFFTQKENEMNMLGKFNVNAMDNAVENVRGVISDARAETENLVSKTDKTYMNFIRPLMDIDAKLSDVTTPVFHLDAVNNSDHTRQVIEDIQPMLSEYYADMARHTGVYNGILEIKKNEFDTLDSVRKKLIDDSIRTFKVAGIDLPADKQQQLKEIGVKLSKASNDFSNNVISANKLNKIKITDEALLGDMPQTDKDVARVEDGWEFSLLVPSYEPFMKYVTDRELRRQMYENYTTRAPENEKIISEILTLRADAARILGFENHAVLAMQFRDAKSPEIAIEYLSKIAAAVKPAALREYNELKEFSGIDLQPWDNIFYSRQLKQEKYNLTDAMTKPYFEMFATIDGVMDTISQMFDIQFMARDAVKWDKDVRYFDVLQNGKIIGGLYLDLQTRESKQSGAWMSDFHSHYRDALSREHLPEIFVAGNFPAARGDAPSLLTLTDLSTLFHEMGHAVHGLLSRTDELDLSGTRVYTDVVEFPSQFLERFWNNPIVLKKIGKHYQTGETIPDDLIERIIAADRFQVASFIIKQLEYAIFDLELHQMGAVSEKQVQEKYDDVRKRVAVVMPPSYVRQQNTFLHIFSYDYSAGYYSYMWADNMAADAYLAMDGNPFNREMMLRYRDTVLSRGAEKDMSELYLDFVGRAPKPDSLLKFYGLEK